jgi:hypothetical protein
MKQKVGKQLRSRFVPYKDQTQLLEQKKIVFHLKKSYSLGLMTKILLETKDDVKKAAFKSPEIAFEAAMCAEKWEQATFIFQCYDLFVKDQWLNFFFDRRNVEGFFFLISLQDHDHDKLYAYLVKCLAMCEESFFEKFVQKMKLIGLTIKKTKKNSFLEDVENMQLEMRGVCFLSHIENLVQKILI